MEDTIRAAVEGLSCEVMGTRYWLRLEWVEQVSHPSSTAYVLRVEFNAVHETTRAPMQVHLLVSLTQLSALTQGARLPQLLDDALHQALLTNPSGRPLTTH